MRTLSLAPQRRALLLRTAAAAVLVLGYADLARGGITLAPVALVLGYAVLIPAAILTWR